VSFRARLTIAAAVAVALAVAAACAAAYIVVDNQLHGEIDRALRDRTAAIADQPVAALRTRFPPPPGTPFGGANGYFQFVPATGPVVLPSNETTPLPQVAQARKVAAGTHGSYFSDVDVAGSHLRVLTTQIAPGVAVQVARPLDENDHTLDRLRTLLILIGAGGIALAALLGAAVARAALTPLRRLSGAAAEVAETRDLSRRVEAAGRDELGKFAGSFNTMLEALDESMQAQRRLVADASHELRTPLTSLRTNIEVLARPEKLPPEEYSRLLADVVAQTEELTALVTDVVELAREPSPAYETEDVRLDLLVAEAVERARRHAPQVQFETHLEPTVVEGVPSRLERAVANLLDNAAKWSPADGGVEVSVRGPEVVVRDHGPGISEADLPHVFDRFYRAPEARGLPGSGLGLAIVRQVAELHGGKASAERAEGGGTRMRLTLV
jgi:two-component system, OmpR family, sensor histidine kinase MprB